MMAVLFMSLVSLFCRDEIYILLLLWIHYDLNEKEMPRASHIYSETQSDVVSMVIYRQVNLTVIGQGYPSLKTKNYNRLLNKKNLTTYGRLKSIIRK